MFETRASYAIAISVLALIPPSGCSSSSTSTDPPAGGVTAGRYVGQVTIEGSKPFVVGTSRFTVDAAGNIKGTVTADATSGGPGDLGSITGTTKPSTTGLVEIELVYESAKLGRYTAKGVEVYNAEVKKLAFAPSARNTSGSVVGRFFFLGEPE